MSQIRLYLDEDVLEGALVQALQSHNVDILTTAEANKLSCTDEEQLIWAREQGRIIYSFNVGDFCRLHNQFIAEDITHAGIILGVQQRYSVGTQLRGILRLIAAKTAEEMINQLVFLRSYMGND